MTDAEAAKPRSCDDEAGAKVPVVDRNRCEGKRDCVVVCPYDVFEVRVLTPEERVGISLIGRLKLFGHRGYQAIVVAPESCHACGLCVAACPERALTLVAAQR